MDEGPDEGSMRSHLIRTRIGVKLELLDVDSLLLLDASSASAHSAAVSAAPKSGFARVDNTNGHSPLPLSMIIRTRGSG